jgi:hypothetical protein
MSLTKEEAAAIVAEWSDAQIEAASGGVAGRPWDLCSRDEQLAVAAVLDGCRRKEAARAAAAVQAPIEAARKQARAAWEQAGSPGDFDTFFAKTQQADAAERLALQRRTAHLRVNF